MSTSGTVERLYVYPVKGLSPQPLRRVSLTRCRGFPHDRVFALARPDGQYRPGMQSGLSKREFYALVSDARLAGFDTHVEMDTGVLTVSVAGHDVLTVELHTTHGQNQLQAFFARVLDLPGGQSPVYAHEKGRRFTDTAVGGDDYMEWISVINLASVRDLAIRTGVEFDHLRFRANIFIDGLPPWSELDLVGTDFSIGEIPFKGMHDTPRCAATEVNPVTGQRDLPVVRMLTQTYNHHVMGIYVQAQADGLLTVGGEVIV
jgi:MOSC domain-containing protein